MRVAHVRVRNWRNFKDASVLVSPRTFLLGANASGKSNFLDIFKFLRDISSSSGGGLQKALKDRGGMSKVRSLAARNYSNLYLEIDLYDEDADVIWIYILEIGQENVGHRRPIIRREIVLRSDHELPVLMRPTDEDADDSERLTQTHLEQVNSNQNFREISDFFSKAIYLHLVPQLLKNADSIQGQIMDSDPYGQGFLERIAATGESRRQRRLAKIQAVLKKAVPQLESLQFERDPINGKPHLKAKYSHWRENGAWQREDQFSDGTLRLIGLFWILQEEPGLLLLEEPELSLNSSIVAHLAPFIFLLQGKGQVIITTHSAELLSDQGIALEEVILLEPSADATVMKPAIEFEDIRALVEGGYGMGQAALPHTAPSSIADLANI